MAAQDAYSNIMGMHVYFFAESSARMFFSILFSASRRMSAESTGSLANSSNERTFASERQAAIKTPA
jgi:hypothetical protein